MNVPTVAELTRGARATDADDVAAAIESRGLTDREALRGYGSPTVFALGESLLAHLRRLRWIRASVRSGRVPYLRAALARASLYAVPVLLTCAAPIDQVGWAVPAGVLLLGWPAVQGLVHVGHHCGPARGVRLVVAGFALAGLVAVVLLWAGSRWSESILAGPFGASPADSSVAGASLAGPSSAGESLAAGSLAGSSSAAASLAAASSAGQPLAGFSSGGAVAGGPSLVAAAWLTVAGLAVFAAMAAAVVAGREAAMLRAFLPACAVAGVMAGGGWSIRVPAAPMLLACTFAAALWTLRSALWRLTPDSRWTPSSTSAMPHLAPGRSTASPRSPRATRSASPAMPWATPAARPAAPAASPAMPWATPAARPAAPAARSATPAAPSATQATRWTLRATRWATWAGKGAPRSARLDAARQIDHGRRREVWPAAAVWRSAFGHGVIGFGQSATLVLVCRVAPGDGPIPPAVIPVLVALPLLEVFAGWRAAQTAGALDAYDSVRAYHRHMIGVTLVSIAGLTPPMFVGGAAALAACLLTHPLLDLPTVRTLVLGLSAGLLLAGLYGVILLLAGQGRTTTAALLSLAPLVLTAAALALTTQSPTARGIGGAEVLAGALTLSYAAGLTTAATARGAGR